MNYILLVSAIFTSGFVGMTSLNFAMNKSHKNLVTHKPFWLNTALLKPIYLRIMGWLFLAMALFLSIQTWSFSIGLAAYFGLLTLVVGVLVFLLSYKMTWVIRLMGTAALLCLFCLGGLMAI